MSAMKPLALGMLVWAATVSVVHADPIIWPNNFNWVAYFAGQNANNGASFALASPSPPVAQPVAAPAANSVVSTPQTPPPAPETIVANAPVAQPQAPTPPVSSPPVSSGPIDAFINLGNGPYPLQNSITTGGALPWYDSSQITSLFGGQPTASQIQSFDSTILQRVQQTFSQSGVSVTLTDNPNVPAFHTLSLVSNTESASLNSAIGMTQLARAASASSTRSLLRHSRLISSNGSSPTTFLMS